MRRPFRTHVFVLLFLVLTLSAYAAPDDFQIIRDRVVSELMKERVKDIDVQAILSKMNTDGSYPDINYGDLSRTAGFPHRRHTSDLVTLAQAYKSRGSKFKV